jgi:hypothetical protein
MAKVFFFTDNVDNGHETPKSTSLTSPLVERRIFAAVKFKQDLA